MSFKPLSFKGVKTYPVKKRKSKVRSVEAASLPRRGGSMKEFFASLPDQLAARDLKAVIRAVTKAHKSGKTVALGMGAHVIKVGLSPIIIDLMERGVVSSVALNGAGIVHDFELAYAGATSEEVDKEIVTGRFGMAKETGSFLNSAIKKGAKKGLGIGRSVGVMIERSRFPNKGISILSAGVRCNVPVTVHVAIGTDIIHVHPSFDGAATGKGAELDLKTFSSVVATLSGGVFINIGSAVVMPEVFLKALTVARNLRGQRKKDKGVKNFTTVNMDFIQHYRPVTNVVRRPTIGNKGGGGRGYTITGHHELMVPLLYAGIIEEL